MKWSKISLGYPRRSFFEATRKEADFPEDLKRRRSLLCLYTNFSLWNIFFRQALMKKPEAVCEREGKTIEMRRAGRPKRVVNNVIKSLRFCVVPPFRVSCCYVCMERLLRVMHTNSITQHTQKRNTTHQSPYPFLLNLMSGAKCHPLFDAVRL